MTSLQSLRREYDYHVAAKDECLDYGFREFAQWHMECIADILERRDFIRQHPTRKARRAARREMSGIR